MRNIKRLFLIVSAFLVVISLASCTGTKRNTVTPMGSIDTGAIVAQSGDKTLNNGVFYSQLRNQGYNTVLNKIKSNLFEEEITAVLADINLTDTTVTDSERQLFDTYASAIYGSSDYETIKEMDTEDKIANKNKFVDACNNEGIAISIETDLADSNVIELEDKVAFKAIPEVLKTKYALNIAINKAAKTKLSTLVDLEEIQDKDGEMVKNSNYLNEDAYKSYYNNNNKKYGEYQAIIVQFNSLTEAKNAINDVENTLKISLSDENITEAQALAFYVNLYNNYYSYRSQITGTTAEEVFVDYGKSNTQTVFTINEDENQLSKISSSVQSIITTTLEEDGDYLVKPFNQNNKYLMVYRGKTTFDINSTYNITEVDKDGYVEWETLKANEAAYNTVYKAIKEKLIDSKVASYTTTVINDRIDAADIKIYDPLFEMKFESSYSDYYELISDKDFDNANIYTLTYNNKSYSYSVEQFYNEQALASGVRTIYNQLAAEFAFNLKDLFVTEEQIESIETEVETSIKTFKNDENTAYPKEIGLETFLVANYGYTTQELVVKSKIAQSALSSYLSDNLFDEWSTDTHEINPNTINALNNILAAGNEKYSDIFSINIDHVLIYIDDNGDGTPDDPEEFTKYFDEETMKDYEKTLKDLANAIYTEANCKELTESNDLMEILNYIVKAYERNEELISTKVAKNGCDNEACSHKEKVTPQDAEETKVTWADYKKYNFLLKVESLSSSGNTTQSNVTNYVKPFADDVRKLYEVVTTNDIKIEDDKPIFVFKSSKNAAPTADNILDDLTKTEFGYHMIVVNKYEKPSTTESLPKNDSNGYQKNVQVLINEKSTDTTGDNIYVVVPNTYNDTEKEKANMNQFFVYYVQKQTGATSTLDADIVEVFDAMFSGAITRYLSSGFQNYLLYNDMNVDVKLETLKPFYTGYKTYLQNTSQSYNFDKDGNSADEFASWYNGSLNWARPYNK